jgi:DNA-binding MarR family transcriptional regulator
MSKVVSEARLRQAIEDLYFGYRAFTEVPDEMLAAQGLARAHHRVLYFVCRRPGIAVGDLTATLNISKQALHRPLKDLTARGLVAISVASHDRRVRTVTATEAGRQLESSLSGAQADLLRSVFDELDDDHYNHWHAVMIRLAETHGHPAGATGAEQGRPRVSNVAS